jgi:hypothetical protein
MSTAYKQEMAYSQTFAVGPPIGWETIGPRRLPQLRRPRRRVALAVVVAIPVRCAACRYLTASIGHRLECRTT